MSIKNWNILFFCGFVFLSCNSEDKVNVISDNFQVDNLSELELSAETAEHSFDYNGNLIQLIGEGNEEEAFTIQQIDKRKGSVTFKVQKIPTELYLRTQGIEGDALKNALIELKDEQLFYLDIGDVKKQDVLKKNFDTNYKAAVSYLAFKIENDFQIISEKDTITANYSHFERSFHLAPYERVLVSFSGIDFSKNFQLIYNDILFKKGTIDFYFAPEQMVNINNNLI